MHCLAQSIMRNATRWWHRSQSDPSGSRRRLEPMGKSGDGDTKNPSSSRRCVVTWRCDTRRRLPAGEVERVCRKCLKVARR